MSEFLGQLGRLAEWLPRGLVSLSPPLLVAGVLYFCLPSSMIEAIGLNPNDPVGRFMAGLAILVGGPITVLLPPTWLRYAREHTLKTARSHLTFWRLPLRSMLHLGPIATGAHDRFYVDPNDENLQLLIDERLAFVELQGPDYMCVILSPDGSDFIRRHRKRLRHSWLDPKNRQAVDDIRRASERAARNANRHV